MRRAATEDSLRLVGDSVAVTRPAVSCRVDSKGSPHGTSRSRSWTLPCETVSFAAGPGLQGCPDEIGAVVRHQTHQARAGVSHAAQHRRHPAVRFRSELRFHLGDQLKLAGLLLRTLAGWPHRQEPVAAPRCWRLAGVRHPRTRTHSARKLPRACRRPRQLLVAWIGEQRTFPQEMPFPEPTCEWPATNPRLPAGRRRSAARQRWRR